MSGRLVLCATPIGNLRDITLRALDVLAAADTIACEDTRRTRKLLSHHGISARDLVSYHDANERVRAPELLRRLRRGETVALVSDAGTPGLSDPGFRLVQACIAAGVPVEAVPGPSAALTALTLSGLPPARFTFEGFLPRRRGERRRRLRELAEDPRTLVLYESPHRLADLLADATDVLGARPAAIARELTKVHEEVRRGPLPELARWAGERQVRGEVVVVVGGAVRGRGAAVPPEELARDARRRMDAGVERSRALSEVARAHNVRRRDVFDALVTGREQD